MPLCLWLLAGLAQSIVRRVSDLELGWPKRIAIPLVAGVAILQVVGLYGDLAAFADAHPIPEVEASVELEDRFGSEITVLGTFRFTRRYVGYRYLLVPRTGASGDPERYYAALRGYVERVHADYVVVGRKTLSDRPSSLLTWEDLPGFLAPLWRTADVAVYRVDLGGAR